MVEGSPGPGRVSGPPRRQQGPPFHGHHRQARRRRAPGPRRPGAHRRRGLAGGRAGQLGHRTLHRAPGHLRPGADRARRAQPGRLRRRRHRHTDCRRVGVDGPGQPLRRQRGGRRLEARRRDRGVGARLDAPDHDDRDGYGARARCRRPVAPAGRRRGPGDAHRRAVRCARDPGRQEPGGPDRLADPPGRRQVVVRRGGHRRPRRPVPPRRGGRARHLASCPAPRAGRGPPGPRGAHGNLRPGRRR